MVVPAYEEDTLLVRTVETMPTFVDHVFIIDDASTSPASFVLNEQGIDYSLVPICCNDNPPCDASPPQSLSVCRHEQNQGVGAAIVTGYRCALAAGADAIAVMAGDAQMDPADLPRLLDAFIEEEADYVKGDRLHGAVWRVMPWRRLVGTTLLAYLTRLSSGLPGLRDSQCGYTVIRAEALRALPLHALYPRYGFPNDILNRLGELGAQVTQVPVAAVYGAEVSGLRVRRVVGPISAILWRGGVRRLRRGLQRHLPWLVLLLAFALGTLLGLRLQPVSAQSSEAEARPEVHKMAELLTLIEQHYWEPADPVELVHQASYAMVKELDSNSRFMPPRAYTAWMSRIHGQSIGPGLELRWAESAFWVKAVVQGSAADEAGIREGDELLALDGARVEGQSLAEVQQRLLGEEGSLVTVSMRQISDGQLVEHALERRKVKREAVSFRLIGGDVVYVKVSSFQRDIAIDVRSAIDALQAEAQPEGAGQVPNRQEVGGKGQVSNGQEGQVPNQQKIRAVILDLRGNLGGLLDEAIYLCNVFLPTGLLIVKQEARGSVSSEHASFSMNHLRLPLAVLIDGKSASASEIVAAALADQGRAVTVGQRSYGKGSVQTTYSLADGSGVKMTTSRYLSPSGKQIDGVGVEPMILVDTGASGDDPAVSAALEALRDAPTWDAPEAVVN